MVLKRFKFENKSDIYFCLQDDPKKDIQEIKLMQQNKCFQLKLSATDKIVTKWAKLLGKTPENYVLSFLEAIRTISNLESDKQLNIFEINKNIFEWKQFFTEKDIFGKMGKFNLEEIDYERGSKDILDVIIRNIDDVYKTNSDLQSKLDNVLSEKEEAIKLTEKSVVMKQELESELYGKFVAILNAKTSKFLQVGQGEHILNSQGNETTNLPSTSNEKQQEKLDRSPKLGDFDDDTDVDSPLQNSDVEIDTDDEAQNAKTKERMKRKSPEPTSRYLSSLNDSLDLDKDLENALKMPICNMPLHNKEKDKDDTLPSSFVAASKRSKLSSSISSNLDKESLGEAGYRRLFSSDLSDDELSSSKNSIIRQMFNC